MILLRLIIIALFSNILALTAFGQNCYRPVELLIVGDSQFGATWSRSYTGNFLQQCLKKDFVLYARGGTIPRDWLGQGGMDHIETIQRDPENEHLNIGSKEKVPECKKRIDKMIEAHNPQKIVFEFGGNYISQTDDFIRKDIQNLVKLIQSKGISKTNCFFIHQTYEMEVSTKRNVPLKNFKNMKRVGSIIQTEIENHCQFIDSFEIMKNSPYFDGQELLKRVPIEGRAGCMGAATNDNAHICGEAARDFAERLCLILN